ncbi:AraC family transcriptional regulator [Chitinophaga sedimenti]|uniref:helix-turn-helix domain-containing protein n=1 Tax=Chitinophaga sedimenti TaxID=2033606 RepID=UPI002006D3E4|nr:AraC family transcriptional regulator [Chitinophaga sedimenti]MCK7557726.1 AraC family transcriptional regulator [Chitinophaga sedimenti]
MKLFCNPDLSVPAEIAPIPAWFESSRSCWMNAACLKLSSGHALLQTFVTDQFSVKIVRFVMKHPDTVYLQLPKSSIALQFGTIGRLVGNVHGLHTVEMEPLHYSMFYVPSEVFRLQLEPGTYESLHFELDPLLIAEQVGQHPEMLQLMHMYETQSKTGMRLMPVAMDKSVHRLLKIIRNAQTTGDYLEALLLNTIGSLLFRYKTALNAPKYAPELSASVYQDTIENIRQEIINNPNAGKHTIAWFAKHYNMSESTLKRKFKTLQGVTLPGFVDRQCMLKAGNLLKERKLTVDDVADELGYSDRSGFSRAFKRMYSKTPGEFRAMWLGI